MGLTFSSTNWVINGFVSSASQQICMGYINFVCTQGIIQTLSGRVFYILIFFKNIFTSVLIGVKSIYSRVSIKGMYDLND